MLEAREGGVVYQRTERMQSGARTCHNRYVGTAVKLADRLLYPQPETM